MFLVKLTLKTLFCLSETTSVWSSWHVSDLTACCYGGGGWMSGCGLHLAQPHRQIPHMRGSTPMFDSSGFSSESWAENGGSAPEAMCFCPSRRALAQSSPRTFGINQWHYRISTAAVCGQMICSAEKIWLKSVWYENEIDSIIIYAHICTTVSVRLMRCFTFEKVLLFCPQVSEDIAFKYMLQLTNCVKSFFTLLSVSDRGLFYSGDMKDRAGRGVQSKQNMVLMLPGIATMPVWGARFPFFHPSLFFSVAQQGRIFPVVFWDTGKIISCFSLLVCSCIKKQSALRRAAQLTEVPD